MNKQSKLNLTLSLLCFSGVLMVFQGFLSSLSIPELSETTAQWLRVAIAVGLFAFIFQLTMWLSQISKRKWLSDESKLIGVWYQIFRIHNYSKKSAEATDAIRHGPVTIAFAGEFLEITAENTSINGVSASSSWHSNKVSIQGHQVWLLYSSTGAGRGSTHGNMMFQYEPRKGPRQKPTRLAGQFSDSSPAIHFGSIELFRDIHAYEERLKELIASVEAVLS